MLKDTSMVLALHAKSNPWIVDPKYVRNVKQQIFQTFLLVSHFFIFLNYLHVYGISLSLMCLYC